MAVEISKIHHWQENQALGNRLFKYCWAREIAEKKGFYLISDPIIGFPETYKILPGKKISENELIPGAAEQTQIFNMNDIYNHSGKILIHGYPQRYEYYAFNKNNILKWLTIENEELYDVPDEDDIVMHVRLSDYIIRQWNAPMEYFISVLRQEKYKNAYIVTEDPTNLEIQKLINFGCILKDNSRFGPVNGSIADFVFLKKAKKIIMSASTFSWWASFLGEGIVYFPCNIGIWSKSPGINDIDLRVLDDPRYRFVDLG
jgi:hypothetical protein